MERTSIMDKKSDGAMERVVVVTGASSGNGLATALALARSGLTTFAGVRSETQAQAIRAHGIATLEPLTLDITSDESVNAAAQTIEQRFPAGLFGLVNNAGVGLAAPIETVDLAQLREIFDINVVGQVRVAQAFLPQLRRAQGRLVNITSIGAYVTVPFIGPLAASKFAFRSINDALRMELAASGIRVVAVAPASIKTEAVDKMRATIDTTIDSLNPDQRKRYAQTFRSAIERGLEEEDQGSPPDVVAGAVLDALTVRRPRETYYVGRKATLLRMLPQLLPTRLLDRVLLSALGIK
jgi:NAD(P)-dependent dehydrogenase (short-subunit alcohol dehydrogenase family)